MGGVSAKPRPQPTDPPSTSPPQPSTSASPHYTETTHLLPHLLLTTISKDIPYIHRCLSRYKSSLQTPPSTDDVNDPFTPTNHYGGITYKQYKNVFGLTKSSLESFNAFDTDRNGLIDAADIFTCLVIFSPSNVSIKKKVQMVLKFGGDLDSGGGEEYERVSYDECNMIVASCLRSVGKITNFLDLCVGDTAGIVDLTYECIGRRRSMDVTKDEVVNFCVSSKEVADFFGHVNRLVEDSKVSSANNNNNTDAPRDREREYKLNDTTVLNIPYLGSRSVPMAVISIPPWRVTGVVNSSHSNLNSNSHSLNNKGQLSPTPPPQSQSQSNGTTRSRTRTRVQPPMSPLHFHSQPQTSILNATLSNSTLPDNNLLRKIFLALNLRLLTDKVDVGLFYLSLKGTSMEANALNLYNEMSMSTNSKGDMDGTVSVKELLRHLFPFVDGEDEEDLEDVMKWVYTGLGAESRMNSRGNSRSRSRGGAGSRDNGRGGSRERSRERSSRSSYANGMGKDGKKQKDFWKEGEEDMEITKMFRTFLPASEPIKLGEGEGAVEEGSEEHVLLMQMQQRITVKDLSFKMSTANQTLDKREIEKMFNDLGKGRRDFISEEEFVVMFKGFVEGDEDSGSGGGEVASVRRFDGKGGETVSIRRFSLAGEGP